jgi:hypothetical protein
MARNASARHALPVTEKMISAEQDRLEFGRIWKKNSHSQCSFVGKSRGGMPRLYLKPDYGLDLAIVLATNTEERLENAIHNEGHFGTD